MRGGRVTDTFGKNPVCDHLGLPAKTGYELVLASLNASDEVRPNLSRCAKGYQTPALTRYRRLVATGE